MLVHGEKFSVNKIKLSEPLLAAKDPEDNNNSPVIMSLEIYVILQQGNKELANGDEEE
jgi:hypothetical protein